ncbi:MFS transporter [Williamsia maris]|uniref:Major Facilitator Superfamily protein n=1 Tax=Williamsia maris TaxID=72806 RepID=A0ABT1HAA0_9NOCA|nr:MFS transporter [Williamsia maris]MCP2174887.1 Major Facilitator Superfamily protein [Williamsia maris]
MPTGEHPGAANYPADSPHRASAYRPPPTHNPHLDPLDPADGHPGAGDRRPPVGTGPGDAPAPDASRAMPRKLTVTRVAAFRGRELTSKGIGRIHRAATADGADRSGLTALTYPTIVNFAVDAAMTVALANTLFFAAASAESKGKVALYLMLTIAPFALIAPLIGPALDRFQKGRRIAMASTFGVRVVLALLIMANCGWDSASNQLVYDPWVLYPCALGLLVLSKSFGVLKSAVTPRVLPPTIDLVRVNSRLTTFGLVGGTIVGGGLAALFETLLGRFLPLHLPGAMVFLAIIATAGAVLCMRIPSWVEVTEGEIPATFTYHGEPEAQPGKQKTFTPAALAAKMRQPLGRNVLTGLWGNATIRILTGFLVLYIAFYAKSNQGTHSGWMQFALLGAVGAAAGVGNFVGNATGTRLELKNPQRIVVLVTAASLVVAVLAAVFGSILFAALAALVASGTSAIGKVCLDSSIQDDLPEESRASAFGRSESVLQLSWVLGAALGVLLPPTLWIGFTVVSVLLALGFAQTAITNRGSTLVPGFGGKRPDQAMPTGSIRVDPHMTRPRPSHPDTRVDTHENGF